MNDLRTAAQQALEALEDWDSPVALPAIVALRAALAQKNKATPPDEAAGLVDDLCLLHMGWKADAEGDLYRAAWGRVIARAKQLKAQVGKGEEMTHDDIIRMAWEAGFQVLLPQDHVDGTGGVYVVEDEIAGMLERFAALVAAEKDKEIQRLQDALAQKHDPVAHSGWVLREVLFDNGEPIGHREPQHSPAALAQQAEPVQEPVAWVYIDRMTGERVYQRHMAGSVDHSRTIEAPLYAAPARSKSC